MRRAARIEQAARAVVDAKPRARAEAIEALRRELDTHLPEGHTPQLDRDAVIARLRNSESQSSIADDLNVTKTSIWRIAKAARASGVLPE